MVAAFPGAEGYGATAFETFNRQNIAVIEVTNLNDSGTGSLRDAIINQTRDGEYDIIIFRVAGYIDLTTPITIVKSGVYIAGQTAPDGGITLRGDRIHVAADDVVIRYLRTRRGLPTVFEGDHDAISAGNFDRVIFDHCSASWNMDENVELLRGLITFQRCITSEAIHKPFGQVDEGYGYIGAAAGGSLHHNLFVSNFWRNPRLQGGDCSFVNNVIYNAHGFRDTWSKETQFPALQVNCVGNTWIAGPAEANYGQTLNFPFNMGSGTTIYVEGNIAPARPTDGLPEEDILNAGDQGNRVGTPHAFPVITTQSPSAGYDNVLADVGCNARLDEDGVLIPNSDSVDIRLLDEVVADTGISLYQDSEVGYGGYPTLANGTAYVDSNGDGIPDAWSIANGISATGAGSHNVDSGNGYTYLEVFLGVVAPPPPPTGIPTVTGVSPNTGPETGGTSVIVSGTNFTGATAVRFDFTQATSFVVDSDTQITAIAPAHIPQVIGVFVTNATGESLNSDLDNYTYVSVPPSDDRQVFTRNVRNSSLTDNSIVRMEVFLDGVLEVTGSNTTIPTNTTSLVSVTFEGVLPPVPYKLQIVITDITPGYPNKIMDTSDLSKERPELQLVDQVTHTSLP